MDLAFLCGCPETCECSYILEEVLEVEGSKDIIAASCRVIITLVVYGCAEGRPTTRVINGEMIPTQCGTLITHFGTPDPIMLEGW